MTTDDCTEMELLLQADHDGELDVAATAKVAAHLAGCPDCTARQAALSRLSADLRGTLSYHAAPDRLRESIAAAAARASPPVPLRLPTAPRAAPWRDRALPFGAGLALAAALAWLVVLPSGDGAADRMADSVVADHIRALQPGHLMDVVSTDQHTVKPWFDGRLDYAPPVKDLAARNFPLIGGRLDYLAGRPVAALAYRRDKHVIDLYVWPEGHSLAVPADGERDGYNFVSWRSGGMVLWAVSDLNTAELREFENDWRTTP